VPQGSTAAAATAAIVGEYLPRIVELKARGEINPEFIDVFCEKGVFEAADSRTIMEAGAKAGLHINFHGDELNYTGSAEMGAALGACAISHLECVSDEGIAAMAAAGTIATLLPTTAYVLRIHPPPARRLIDAGVPVALGTDFNPNAHCVSMPHAMNLACVLMRMTVNEALVAATINAAASLRRGATHGSLEVGKVGDFVLLNAAPWEHLVYEMCDPPIEAVFKRGQPMHRS
jgi:imidazolonepropionase